MALLVGKLLSWKLTPRMVAPSELWEVSHAVSLDGAALIKEKCSPNRRKE